MGGTVLDDCEEPRTTTSTLEPGVSAAGRYRIARFIASGAMGEVYEAEDLVLGTRVALKALRPDLAGSSRVVERLRREILYARKITHRNVCRVYDVGEHAGRVFLTMELLAGETLSQRIHRIGPLPHGLFEHIAEQLVDALSAAHRVHVVHRDLKSPNIVLVDGADGVRAVVTDFGLARSSEPGDDLLTGDRSLLGTPAYMAPEQVEGREATAVSDIYSLGVVLYEMATGSLPFQEDTALATATARLHKEPPRPSSLRQKMEPAWESAILRCLAREPEARFQRVEQLLEAGRVRPRRRWPLLAVALAILVAAVGAASSVVDTRRVDTLVEMPRHWPTGVRPGSTSAAIHFEDAHMKLKAGDWIGARQPIEQAVASEPDDPVSQAALAEVLHELGLAERAGDANRRAMGRLAGISEEARLFVMVRDALVRGDSPAGVALHRDRVSLAPEVRLYQLGLAGALVRSGAIPEARQAVERLGEPRTTGERVRFALWRVQLAIRLGNFVEAAILAKAAAELAGRADRAHDQAAALTLLGEARWALDERSAATTSFKRAIDIARTYGDLGGTLRPRAALIELDLAAGRVREMTDRYLEQVAAARALGDVRLLAELLRSSARYLTRIGRPDEALTLLDEALEIAVAREDEEMRARAEAHIGWVLKHQGRLAEAPPYLERAYLTGKRLEIPGLRGFSFFSWAQVLVELDDEEGRERARTLRTDIERLVDAYIALRLGDAVRAERIARPLMSDTYEGMEAQVVAAHAAIRLGRLSEGARLLEEVSDKLNADGSSLLWRARLIRAQAELRALRGDLPEALALLDRQASECTAAGLHFCAVSTAALAADLAAPERPAEARRRVAAVVAQAAPLGFKRIIRELGGRPRPRGNR